MATKRAQSVNATRKLLADGIAGQSGTACRFKDACGSIRKRSVTRLSGLPVQSGLRTTPRGRQDENEESEERAMSHHSRRLGGPRRLLPGLLYCPTILPLVLGDPAARVIERDILGFGKRLGRAFGGILLFALGSTTRSRCIAFVTPVV
ncbi:hypothetical protein QCM80_31045 [Bradyrhizobium sp. SSUT112]|uniref:hypothetical protein n=1 Tax=Bradyrhizobium sp. SSUT112 TaxID=3040604 RepID=UPI00244B4087|nr:hypothetical protein [Bradyrhizobium sp. SSUT112]MDH2355070.1 hypothetical protein [Bradyrhizobium sp. SSUT112]